MEWSDFLKSEFEKEHMKNLSLFLKEEIKNKKTIYPPMPLMFSAFNSTPFSEVKVVILGQDPYHGEGQACGLAFSVMKGTSVPPSLVNIYKELNNDIGVNIPSHGDLRQWAMQGVLLLNDVLTVQKSSPASHKGKGWELFTDNAISLLNNERQGLVFLLWGKHAQLKAAKIDKNKHYVLSAAHPSPFSAYNGFFGCKHFSKTNEILIKNNQTPINWQIEN